MPDQQGSLQDQREAFDDPAGAQLDRGRVRQGVLHLRHGRVRAEQHIQAGE
ncbi:hypothetical protein [Actinoallomurus oryzae]|uniref:hypothetical protein n=1 Tax=Actinoallomurus oryzae TaxID=502180 RepID=UPI0031ED8046